MTTIPSWEDLRRHVEFVDEWLADPALSTGTWLLLLVLLVAFVVGLAIAWYLARERPRR